MKNNLIAEPYPVDIVLHPRWWHIHEGISFDRDFFYHPKRRVEDERIMEKALYQRWGQFGLGKDRNQEIPWIGAVHLAAGYLVSEMLGCQINYKEDDSPQVICAEGDYPEVSVERAFSSSAWEQVETLKNNLYSQFGMVKGDINWGGILNTALDLKGQNLFLEMFDDPQGIHSFLKQIAEVIETFISRISGWTGTSSISVNRSLINLNQAVYLHSECSHTMISVDDYDRFLKPFDQDWSSRFKPYGIHYCGKDPDRFAESWSDLNWLDFLDVGAGGDPSILRKHLPDTFLNLRLDPVALVKQTPGQIEEDMRTLARKSGNPLLTGFCCVNLDDTVSEEQVDAIFKTADILRKEVENE